MIVTECMDLKQIIAETDKSLVRCLDTEGAPQEITQASMVDGTEKELLNRFYKGGMNSGAKKQITTLVNKSRLLIGFNINADINALAKKQVFINSNVLIVDLFLTFKHLMETNQIPSPPDRQTLKDVAAFYGITGVCGYHNSMVDSTITMQLFWKMNKKVDGKFVVIKKPQLIEFEFADDETEDTTKEGKVTLQNPREYMDYSNQTEEAIRPISKNMYEAVVNMYGIPIIVRLTKKEYKLFNNIRKVTPNYPLWVFYRTIVAPGVIHRDIAYKEKEAEVSAAAGDFDISDALN